LVLTVLDIRAINVTPRFSSRDVAEALFGDQIDLSKFSGYHESYRSDTFHRRQAAKPKIPDEDRMDIDEDAGADALHPSHALDLLHIQVVDHFTRLLVELVGRIGGQEVQGNKNGGSASRYAPSWSKKNYLQYDASDCLDYLGSKKPIKPCSPRLDIFLRRPYEIRGSRRGQDWSRKDWMVALTSLGDVGDAWGEGSIRESLFWLEPHLGYVFSQAMRPTGI
jgi:hypothetical protein